MLSVAHNPPVAADAWLGAMADAAPQAMIAVSTPALRIVAINRAGRQAARMCGVVGERLVDAFPLLDRPEVLDLVAAVASGRQPGGRLRVTSAALCWDVACTPMPPAAGEAGVVLLTAGEVSDPPAAAAWPEAAVADDPQLHAFLAQLPAAVFIVAAPDGRLAFQSRLVDDVLGQPCHDMRRARQQLSGWALHPDGRPYELQDYPSRRTLFGGETIHAEPMIYRCGDGRLIDLEVYAGPVRDAAQTIVAAVVAAFDVTERKRAEARLRDSEERLRLAVEAGGLGTWEVDLVRNVSRFGDTFAAMLGLPASPFMSDRADAAARYIHPDDVDAVRHAFNEAMAQGALFKSEYRGRAADGSTRWFVSRGRFLHGADGKPVRAVGVVHDVTERRAREDRLRETIQARDLLLREADHRIKNSLQLVASLLRLQRSRLADADAAAALDSAILRVMAVGEAHKALHQSADLRDIDFAAMLGDLCAHVGALNPALRFSCDCPPGFQLDTGRAIPLGLIVSELLTNAAKHAYPDGAGLIRTTVATDGDIMRITVADAGVGLPADAARRAGLGSSIVRSLAAQVGVEIDLLSSPGSGTQAHLSGPLRPP